MKERSFVYLGLLAGGIAWFLGCMVSQSAVTDATGGAACGFAVCAGLCMIAAAIAQEKHLEDAGGN